MMEEYHKGHGKVKKDEEANVKGKNVVVVVAAAAEDEEVEGGEEDEVAVVVAVECGHGKEIEKDVGLRKEEHAHL